MSSTTSYHVLYNQMSEETTSDRGMLNRLGLQEDRVLGEQFWQVLGNRCHPDGST